MTSGNDEKIEEKKEEPGRRKTGPGKKVGINREGENPQIFPKSIACLVPERKQGIIQSGRFKTRLTTLELDRLWFFWVAFPSLNGPDTAVLAGCKWKRLEQVYRSQGWPTKTQLREKGINSALLDSLAANAPRIDAKLNNVETQAEPKNNAPLPPPIKTIDPSQIPTTDYLISRVKQEIDSRLTQAQLGDLSFSLGALLKTAEAAKGRSTESGKTLSEICLEIRKRKMRRRARDLKRASGAD